MNKTELINKIAAKAEISKVDAKKALDSTTEVIMETLKSGDFVRLVGFGTYSVSVRPEREYINRFGKNGGNGEKKISPEKRVPKFKAGSELVDFLNS